MGTATVISTAAEGLVSGAILTGTPEGALKGAVTGGLFGYASTFGEPASLTRALAHAGAGCLSGELQGGGCGRGALSAGVAKYAVANTPGFDHVFLETVRYTVIGGTASAIGGGKFANGVATAAFLHTLSSAAQYYESRVGGRADLSPGGRLYTDSEGKCCSYPIGEGGQGPGTDYNVIGLNNPLEGSFWHDFGSQGGPLSNALNLVPGINATAHLHDWWFNSGTLNFNLATNISSMIPVSMIAYGAGLGQYLQGWHQNPMTWHVITYTGERRWRR